MNVKSPSTASLANLFSLPSTSTVIFFDAISRFLICCFSSAERVLKPVISKVFAFDKIPLCLCFNLTETLSLVLSLKSTFGLIKYSNVFLSIKVVSATLISLEVIVLAILLAWFSTETPLIFSSSLAKMPLFHQLNRL
ncbi:hypothetical protein NPL1_03065 [Metamycoplasma hyosynoviae]|nr:hypothetical protein [Metamycoplasma hyosynoviae]KDE42612.1 hypothetical protein NPL1_03065 [Metamycoplasma hyosynoviae]MDD1372555.1 hypothetical protein [Metamycoplasma hyosynoviae]MDI3063864.1 hypothetical protein [Metamycoplasma hyosynoviae]